MAESVGTGQLFDNVQEGHDDVGADATVAREFELAVSESLPGATLSVTNLNGVRHKIGCRSAVRHDGTGQTAGARLSAINSALTIAAVTSHWIIEDLLIMHTGVSSNRHVLQPLGDDLIIRRCALINLGTVSTSRAVNGANSSDRLHMELNTIFSDAGSSLALQLGLAGIDNKFYLNTIVTEATKAMSVLNLKNNVWDARGTLIVMRVAGTEYLNGAGGDSTKNAGEDGTAIGSNPIDFTDDLSLPGPDLILDLIVSDALASLNLLRVAANHGGAGQEVGDLSALLTDDKDILGNTFNQKETYMGSQQIALLDDDGKSSGLSLFGADSMHRGMYA